MDSEQSTAVAENASELARASFTTGCNCAESVIVNTSAAIGLPSEVLPQASGYAWTGGIDESGCLCGSLSAAVSLAGIVAEAEGGSEAQQRARARELADEIQSEFVTRWRGSCCRIVRNGLEFGTPECHANCQEVTAFATATAVEVLGRARQTRLRGPSAALRSVAAISVGLVAGLEAASLFGSAGLFGVAGASVVLGGLAGAAWAFGIVTRPDLRRALARPGRVAAAIVAVGAALLAATAAIAPQLAISGEWLGILTGLPATGPLLRLFWVIVVAAFAVPVVRNLLRRKGSA
jgi:C_GCAxxG_C_C family probable redox protein